jgi:hypothetical protein
MIMDKSVLLKRIEQLLIDKIQFVQSDINQLRVDISSDSKSTAGDKHETSRAMAQLEMEKLGKQLLDYQKQLQTLKQFDLNPLTNNGSIQQGSLVQLSNGWYFLGLGIGKVELGEQTVFCISIQSPLGQQLLNKKIGQEILLPNMNLKIVEVN